MRLIIIMREKQISYGYLLEVLNNYSSIVLTILHRDSKTFK